MRTMTFKRAGDLEIKADIHAATGEARQPVLVWIHGGALMGGNRNNLSKDQLALYRKAGYAVVSIDYRLAPETKLPEIIADLEDAFAWIREEAPKVYPIDPDRLAVIGHSAGGYLTLMAGFRVKPRPKALVSFYGYGDIVGDWYSKPDPYYSSRPAVSREEALAGVGSTETAGEGLGPERFKFYLYCRQNGLWPREVSGHDPVSDPSFFVPYCPLRNVTPEYPPTLLLHGDADTDVPYQESVLMAEELARHGVPHELVTIPKGPHVFDHANGGLKGNPEVRVVFDRVLSFLSIHLGE
ncbi:MAG: alpha/beta hydrolase [Candidatus Omnitrophica bacterium]|nr:Acetyl esterase [bacterium]NUN98252.1 alpha/beta hydrolase [Candidatus Omnitrophota bacterium]